MELLSASGERLVRPLQNGGLLLEPGELGLLFEVHTGGRDGKDEHADHDRQQYGRARRQAGATAPARSCVSSPDGAGRDGRGSGRHAHGLSAASAQQLGARVASVVPEMLFDPEELVKLRRPFAP